MGPSTCHRRVHDDGAVVAQGEGPSAAGGRARMGGLPPRQTAFTVSSSLDRNRERSFGVMAAGQNGSR
jgi:hypothetical protein